MSQTFKKEDVVGVECRFAVMIDPPHGSTKDYHLVKEQIHVKNEDDSIRLVPNVRLIENYKRPFWITKPAYRNHETKKEYERLDRVLEFKSTQSQLIPNISRALEQPFLANTVRGQIRKLHRNPFIYGTDILSTALIKRAYQTKFPELNTRHSVATFDTETDVVTVKNPNDGEILMATVTMKSVVYTVVQKRFYEGRTNVQERLQTLFHKYLGDHITARNLQWEVVIVDSEAEVILKSFAKIHELQPDFLEIWNLDFDISKVIKGLEKAGIDPKDVFSDPCVPPEYRFFKYKRGPEQKVTASGKVTPIKPAARWHTVTAPASFYVIDGMCAYRHIRNGQQEKQSYSLDAILADTFDGKIQKLKFEEAAHLSGLQWHQYMQANHPLEYTVYNVFDCVSMEIQDEKLKDLSVSLPMMSGSSDYENFKSQPRRVVDELHHFVLSRGHVMGTTSDEMSEDVDEETIGLKDWIVMLPAHLVANNGLKVIKEDPNMVTNIRRDVGDKQRHLKRVTMSHREVIHG